MPREFNKLDRFISYCRLYRIKKFIKSGIAICDLGCGDGNLLIKLDKALHFKYGLGVDMHVKPGRIGNLEFINNNIKKIPINENQFDIVLMLAVIEHIEICDVKSVLEEAGRILKHKGFIILTTPTVFAKPVLEFLAFKLKMISQAEISEHKHYYKIKELSLLLAEKGFKKVKAGYFQLFMNSFYVYVKDK